MMNHPSWSRTFLGGLVLGTLLFACASANPTEPPPASPASGAAAPETKAPPITIPPPQVLHAADSALKSARGCVNPDDWTSRPTDPPATKSLKSLDAPTVPFIFAARRASEALDHLAGLVVVRHERRGDVITLPCDKMVEPGQWTINTTGQFALKELAPGLRDQDGHAIIIQGYTDSLGISAVNDALSLRRAEAVRDFFVTQGVAAESLRAEGLGAKRPVASNSTPDGRAQNRRIEIVITP
jgi:outer membrane protein OmpA-like peptidoglycan-associated protein